MNLYRADYDDDTFEIYYADNDANALNEARYHEEKDRKFSKLTRVNEDYSDIKKNVLTALIGRK